jgi:hypothetical protein
MASTYSALKIQLMGTGENSGTWGNVTNVNLGTALEEAIVGSADVTFTSANVTLSLTDSNASQTARNLRLNLVGTTGGARDLIVPAIEKVYIVNNGCADTVTIKNSSGTGISVPPGKTEYVYNNGTNVVEAINHLTSLTLDTALPVTSGGTGSNSATFSGANITALNASAVSSGTLDNARTTAASANGASTIVARDASGNFTGANVSATNFIGALNGTGSNVTGLNASNIASGTVPTARLGSGTANNTTFLRGDQTYAAISSVPETLASTFPLKSGTTVTAGRAVNVNSSGEVGDYPVLNSLGSVVTNASWSYNQISLNATRGLQYSDPGSGTVTIRGADITSSTATVGGTTASLSYNSDYGNQSSGTSRLTDTQFVAWSGYFDGFSTRITRTAVFAVDASGNVTKGSETNFSASNTLAFEVLPFIPGFYRAYTYDTQTGATVFRSATLAGNLLTYTTQANLANWASNYTGIVTSNNIAVGISGATAWRATWNGSSLGTPTSQTLVSGATGSAGICLSATSAFVLYKVADNSLALKTFSIDQTTGVLTEVSSLSLEPSAATTDGFSIALKNTTELGFSYTRNGTNYFNTASVNSSGTLLGVGIPLATTGINSLGYTGTVNEFRNFTGNRTQSYTANTYNTPSWNFAGTCAVTQNTSPANIVVNGIATGFTSLTPGFTYYLDTATYNGSLTTVANPYVIGLAVSSTTMRLF